MPQIGELAGGYIRATSKSRFPRQRWFLFVCLFPPLTPDASGCHSCSSHGLSMHVLCLPGFLWWVLLLWSQWLILISLETEPPQWWPWWRIPTVNRGDAGPQNAKLSFAFRISHDAYVAGLMGSGTVRFMSQSQVACPGSCHIYCVRPKFHTCAAEPIKSPSQSCKNSDKCDGERHA